MGNEWFQFKQFRIEQRHSAMKVGTDGVLLGSWVPIENAQYIFDAGTGTGLIALMVAQRSSAKIDAIEIEDFAFEEAKLNFRNSKWNDRLNLYYGDFREFSLTTSQTYDLIVSNPPFFVNSLKSKTKASNLARHNDILNFNDLLIGSRRLLKNTGRLCVVLPAGCWVEFRETARLAGFYPGRQTSVTSREGKKANRVLMELCLERCYPTEDELFIANTDGSWSDHFQTLTSPFYLAF